LTLIAVVHDGSGKARAENRRQGELVARLDVEPLRERPQVPAGAVPGPAARRAAGSRRARPAGAGSTRAGPTGRPAHELVGRGELGAHLRCAGSRRLGSPLGLTPRSAGLLGGTVYLLQCCLSRLRLGLELRNARPGRLQLLLQADQLAGQALLAP